MRIAPGWLWLLLGLAFLASGAAAQPPFVPVYELEVRPKLGTAQFRARGWDAIQYQLWLDIRPESREIWGRLALSVSCRQAGADSLELDLLELTVDSVFVDGDAASFRRPPRRLDVHFPRPRMIGDTVSLVIYYHGRPVNDGFGGFFFTPRSVFTIGEGIYSYPPSMTRSWLPCLDHPADKALFELQARVPSSWIVASNGSPVAPTEQDSASHVWRSRHPMATYLFALAAGEYDTLRQDVIFCSGDTLPVVNYVYPEKKEGARRDYRNVPQALLLFSQWFGRYPFEKYGTVMAPCRGAMEHQTLTTLSDALVEGTQRYELVFIHELAHQWWGDLVTLSDWPDIWLNEGFASYCEALFVEHFYGKAALRSLLSTFASRYFAEEKRLGAFPVYNPPADRMWGATVYQKGAWVLHMLRFLLGDSTFFDALRTYRDTFAFGNATTRDFQAVVEQVSSQCLEWFFDQWLYRAGHPVLEASWIQRSPDVVELRLDQVQKGTLYTLPVEVEIAGDRWAQRDTVWLSSRTDTFAIRIRCQTDAAKVESLRVDPDAWLLREVRYVPVLLPGEFILELPFPNPMRTQTALRFRWGRSAPSRAALEIVDLRGRRVRTLFDALYYGPGEALVWDRRDDGGQPVPCGVYLAVLRAGDRRQVRKLVVLPE
jgi:aminopeptidase N